MEKFRVSTSVEAGGKVAFELTYEELLQRHLGKYQHAISIRPQQVVKNLSVEVSISERTGIDYIHVLPLRTSRLLTNTLRGTNSPKGHFQTVAQVSGRKWLLCRMESFSLGFFSGVALT